MVMTFSPPVTPAPKRSDGTRVPRSLKPMTPCCCRAWPVTAVMAIGTFCRFSDRRWAVTTTSSTTVVDWAAAWAWAVFEAAAKAVDPAASPNRPAIEVVARRRIAALTMAFLPFCFRSAGRTSATPQ